MGVLYDLTDAPPSAFIQWKGTDVCLDFTCDCGWEGHFDGYFAYVVICGGCKKRWQMPTSVPLRPDSGGDFGGVHPEPDEPYDPEAS